MKLIKEWVRECFELAKSKGWDDGDRTEEAVIASFVANLHGEVSELWEAWRAGRLNMPCDKAAKMAALNLTPLTCAEEELADIAIRTFYTAGKLGIDLEHAIEVKHAYNATRAHRHGGKLA